MTETGIGQLDNEITKFLQEFKPSFWATLQDYAAIGKITKDKDEINKAINRIIAFEEQGHIDKLKKEVHGEIAHIFELSKSFLMLEQNLLYLLNKIKDDEHKIWNVVHHLKDHGFPEGDAQELEKETAQVIMLLNRSMRRVSDMMGALEKKSV